MPQNEIRACSFQNEQLSLEVAVFPFSRKVNPTMRSSPADPGATGGFVQGTQLLRNEIKPNRCLMYTQNPLYNIGYAIPFLFGLQVI